MKNNTILKTNLLVCFIIIIGFTVTSIISYRSNVGIFQRDMELVSNLSTEGLYNEISNIFAQPIGAALTMANDTLLSDFLLGEQQHQTDEEWENRMQDYLNAYRLKYQYDSVFLVSATTNNYYHFEGMNRNLVQDNPENTWYYNFLEQPEEYALNVDNDEATDDSITVFVNCRIKDKQDATLGIVGVGLRVDSLQDLLREYEEKYGIRAYLVNEEGRIEVSTAATGFENKNLFDAVGYAQNKEFILGDSNSRKNFWYSSDFGNGYVVTQYEPNLKWHLVVENDTTVTDKQLNMQLFRNIMVIIIIALLVLFIITTVIKRFNAKILDLTISQELEYQHLLHQMTEGLYENILELDITHNCAGGESTRKYFERLDISADATYDMANDTIAMKQIKEEYVQGYLNMFSTEAVLKAFQDGITNLYYDFMISSDGSNYRWVRLSARIFFWNSDKSVRMITYRMNIDAQKRRELHLLDEVQRDSMTGLYNKRTTEQLITEALKQGIEKNSQSAFLIFDIDNFKNVNDTMGHSFGDTVIHEIANEIKIFFTEDDVTGRIGGDEFVVFVKDMGTIDGLKEKLLRLCKKVHKKNFGEPKELVISFSIGVSIFPKDGLVYSELYEKADQALYNVKNHGKSSFSIFDGDALYDRVECTFYDFNKK